MIPSHYILKLDRQDIANRRDITIRRYGTSIPFKPDDIKRGLDVNSLSFGDEFGVIKVYPSSEPNNIRSLWGVVGERNLILLNEETNELDYLRIRHVLLSTLMIEFFQNTDGFLELLIYGGRQARNQLWKTLEYDFAVNPSPFQRNFEPDAVRTLCEQFFDSLTSINISPSDQDGWETISVADFKSYNRRFILRTAKRMQQIYDNKDIIITSFESVMDKQIMMPPMTKPSNVQFKLLKDSGITLSFPPLEVSHTLNELEVESAFYDLARQVYGKIMGDRNLYANVKTYLSQQRSLFDQNYK